jgi:hypothetical protein
MDIVHTTNGTYILVNVVIVDLTRADPISRIIFSQGVVITIATQAKVVPYCNQDLEDDFILLTKKIFGCLYQ